MDLHKDKKRIRTICIVLSAISHLILLFPLGIFGSYNYTRPVSPLQAVMVDLKAVDNVVHGVSLQKQVPQFVSDAEDHSGKVANQAEIGSPDDPVPPEVLTVQKKVIKIDNGAPDKIEPDEAPAASEKVSASTAEELKQTLLDFAAAKPMRESNEFMATVYEKLSYRISMHGVPLGSAELEARDDQGEVRIKLTVQSMTPIYDVNDVIETRHLRGNFILTTMRQHEGGFVGDRGFTIFLRDKRVFWINRLKNRSATEKIPNSEVLDLLSGIYFLRNRTLQVGKTETVHVFDRDTYAAMPVKVLRHETIRLYNLKQMNTLVIQPILKTDGMIRNKGDLLIWFSRDANKVPVRFEISTPVGKISAELVSAESQSYQNSPL